MNYAGLVPQFLKSIMLNSTANVSFRNLLRNGNFNVNQRVLSGTVTLAAGVYGHDGWKAGASGCTYTFALNLNGDTVLTITSGSLLQIIEGKMYVKNTTGVLSWVGTATARVYQGAVTGSFVASPAIYTGLSVNTNTTVEFSTGTVTLAQFEPGNCNTPFEYRDDELIRCQLYYNTFIGAAGSIKLSAYTALNGTFSYPFPFATMRSTPTFTLIGTWTYVGTTTIVATVSMCCVTLSITGTALGMTSASNPNNGGFSLSCEL